VEYSRHGTLLRGHEKAQAKSRFEEDVYINNHTVNRSAFVTVKLFNFIAVKFHDFIHGLTFSSIIFAVKQVLFIDTRYDRI